jgi:predicted transcriptional regulator
MFNWLFGKNNKKLEEETKKSFSLVKEDIEKVGKWIKHLDETDKQLFDVLSEIKRDLSSIRTEVDSLREGIDLVEMNTENKQLLKNSAVLGKQTAVQAVQEGVQTPVQTGNFSDFLKSLSSNERLIVFTLLQSEMKLSYEDLALLLGKERSTVRGQINAIKQKSEGLIEEFIEKNGKKRVFIPDEMKEKLSKYAKVRVRGKKKAPETEEKHE